MPRAYAPNDEDEDDIDPLFGNGPLPEPPQVNPFAGLEMCVRCKGTGTATSGRKYSQFCKSCDGVGWFGLSTGPTDSPPGSEMKTAVLSARYARGMDLFDPQDAKFGSDE